MLRYFARSAHRTLSGERSLRQLDAELAEHLLTLMDDLERTYTPAEAAEVFGFAPSLLRRYAAIYEAVGGTIPHDRRGGRIYSQQVLEHFSKAREQVKAGETVEDALRTFDLAAPEAVPDVQTNLDAKHLLSLLERLADTNARLVTEVADLRAEVAEVRRAQLEAPVPKTSDAEEQQTLRYEVASLRSELAQARLQSSGATPEQIAQALEVEMQAASEDGVMVRAARWLERRLRRK